MKGWRKKEVKHNRGEKRTKNKYKIEWVTYIIEWKTGNIKVGTKIEHWMNFSFDFSNRLKVNEKINYWSYNRKKRKKERIIGIYYIILLLKYAITLW